jgi:hypothetical protein
VFIVLGKSIAVSTGKRFIKQYGFAMVFIEQFLFRNRVKRGLVGFEHFGDATK